MRGDGSAHLRSRKIADGALEREFHKDEPRKINVDSWRVCRYGQGGFYHIPIDASSTLNLPRWTGEAALQHEESVMGKMNIWRKDGTNELFTHLRGNLDDGKRLIGTALVGLVGAPDWIVKSGRFRFLGDTIVGFEAHDTPHLFLLFFTTPKRATKLGFCEREDTHTSLSLLVFFPCYCLLYVSIYLTVMTP